MAQTDVIKTRIDAGIVVAIRAKIKSRGLTISGYLRELVMIDMAKNGEWVVNDGNGNAVSGQITDVGESDDDVKESEEVNKGATEDQKILDKWKSKYD